MALAAERTRGHVAFGGGFEALPTEGVACGGEEGGREGGRGEWVGRKDDTPKKTNVTLTHILPYLFFPTLSPHTLNINRKQPNVPHDSWM